MKLPHFANKQKIKIGGALVVALIAANILSNKVFWLGSPRVSPQFIADVKNAPFYIRTMPARTLASMRGFFAQFNKANREQIENFENVPYADPPASTIFSPIKTGVYAGYDEQTKERYMKIEAGTQVMYHEFIITNPDGTTQKVTLPIPVSLLTVTPTP
jgi:hypothetical protein